MIKIIEIEIRKDCNVLILWIFVSLIRADATYPSMIRTKVRFRKRITEKYNV